MTATKSVRLSKKGQFVIPKEFREALHLRAGDRLQVTIDGEKVILTRPEKYAQATRGMLKGTWGKSRRAVERYLDRERRSWD